MTQKNPIFQEPGGGTYDDDGSQVSSKRRSGRVVVVVVVVLGSGHSPPWKVLHFSWSGRRYCRVDGGGGGGSG